MNNNTQSLKPVDLGKAIGDMITKNHSEFIGQVIDIFEKHLSQKSDDPDEIHITETDYDRLNKALRDLFNSWRTEIGITDDYVFNGW